MRTVKSTDRIEFWKFCHAAVTFSKVSELCDYMIKNNVNPEHPLHIPLIVAVVILYGKPFKQRPETRIPEHVVPPQYKKPTTHCWNAETKCMLTTMQTGLELRTIFL